jgi:hypothetical protein
MFLAIVSRAFVFLRAPLTLTLFTYTVCTFFFVVIRHRFSHRRHSVALGRTMSC